MINDSIGNDHVIFNDESQVLWFCSQVTARPTTYYFIAFRLNSIFGYK